MSELCSSLKAVRSAHGLTQQQLADAVQVSRKTINTVENGVFIPSTVLSLKLARTLDVTVEKLFQLSADSR